MGLGKLAVNCFLAKIIRSLKAKHPTIDHIDLFSDGECRAEVKQKYLFLVCKSEYKNWSVPIQQNLFAMSYGKGVIEGIEGDTKRFVTQVVGSCDDALEISFL